MALINGWENCEPKDKSKKDAIRTYWTRDKDEEKKMSSKKNSPKKSLDGKLKMKDTIRI